MVVESYIIIGRIIEVNCEQMMDFVSKIMNNGDISDIEAGLAILIS
jgi:hypothetical protein